MAGLDDSDDKNENEIAGGHLAELQSSMRKARAAPEDEDEVVAEDPPEPDDEDDEPELKPQTRQDKRNGRVTARERAAAAEAKAELLAEQLKEERARRAEAAPAPRGNPAEAIDQRIRANYERRERLEDEWAAKSGKASADELTRMKNAAIDLDVEKTTLIAERRDLLLRPQRENESKVAALRSRAPDVYDNPRAFQYAKAHFEQQIALGKPDSIELHDEAMEIARQAVLGKRPKPDAAQRQRTSGIGAGARVGGAAEAPVRLSMPAGSVLDRLARAAYPKDDPAVARQKWANANGKEYVAARQRDRG